jgi:hypothetical protein
MGTAASPPASPTDPPEPVEVDVEAELDAPPAPVLDPEVAAADPPEPEPEDDPLPVPVPPVVAFELPHAARPARSITADVAKRARSGRMAIEDARRAGARHLDEGSRGDGGPLAEHAGLHPARAGSRCADEESRVEMRRRKEG